MMVKRRANRFLSVSFLIRHGIFFTLFSITSESFLCYSVGLCGVGATSACHSNQPDAGRLAFFFLFSLFFLSVHSLSRFSRDSLSSIDNKENTQTQHGGHPTSARCSRCCSSPLLDSVVTGMGQTLVVFSILFQLRRYVCILETKAVHLQSANAVGIFRLAKNHKTCGSDQPVLKFRTRSHVRVQSDPVERLGRVAKLIYSDYSDC